MRYKFRAECVEDVYNFLSQLGGRTRNDIIDFYIARTPPYRDVDVVIDIDTMDRKELKEALEEVIDGHVMLETFEVEELEYKGKPYSMDKEKHGS